MAPEDEKGEAVESELISHGNNSHTFLPKIVQEEPIYIDQFKELNGTYLVDLPGMFDSKGEEMDVAMDLML